MDHIVLPDDIPLPPEEIPLPPDDDIPLPPDEVPLPPDEISLPPDEIPLPPDEIPLPPDGESEQDRLEQVQHQHRQLKRPQSPAQETRASKKSRLDNDKKNKDKKKGRKKLANCQTDDDGMQVETMTDEQVMMARVMGFSSFNSTKGKMVPDNQSVGAVHVVKKQRCRQYMNRKGGFNRPLDKTS